MKQNHHLQRWLIVRDGTECRVVSREPTLDRNEMSLEITIEAPPLEYVDERDVADIFEADWHQHRERVLVGLGRPLLTTVKPSSRSFEL